MANARQSPIAGTGFWEHFVELAVAVTLWPLSDHVRGPPAVMTRRFATVVPAGNNVGCPLLRGAGENPLFEPMGTEIASWLEELEYPNTAANVPSPLGQTQVRSGWSFRHWSPVLFVQSTGGGSAEATAATTTDRAEARRTPARTVATDRPGLRRRATSGPALISFVMRRWLVEK